LTKDLSAGFSLEPVPERAEANPAGSKYMRSRLVHYWGWLLAFGAALVMLGIAAIGRAVTGALAVWAMSRWSALHLQIHHFGVWHHILIRA
jgi:hypothetical protein